MARVLIVEDEEIINQAMVRMLEMMGHQPVPAYDVDEAIQHLSQDNNIEAVFSDYNLLRRNGREIYDWVQEHRPELGFTFVSGTVEELPGRRLTKPATMEDIEWALNKMLQTS